jgi:hypothetical protein
MALALALLAASPRPSAATTLDPTACTDADRKFLSARLLWIDAPRSEIAADVAGRREVFQVLNPVVLDGHAEGDEVVLTLKDRGSNPVVLAIDARWAEGRVAGVEGRSGLLLAKAGHTRRYDVPPAVRDQYEIGEWVRLRLEGAACGPFLVQGVE